jgi:hypothetical protein
MGRRLTQGLLLIAAGFVTAALIAVPRFLDVKDRIESFPKTRLSEGSVELEAREYDLYLDVPSGTGDAGYTGPSIRDPQGRELPVRSASADITYDWFGREGSRIGTVRVRTAGRHVVRGTGPPGADLVFADDVIGDMGRTLVFAGAAFFILGAAGVAMIVIALARRRPQEPARWP